VACKLIRESQNTQSLELRFRSLLTDKVYMQLELV
jgi:hypothetical protein